MHVVKVRPNTRLHLHGKVRPFEYPGLEKCIRVRIIIILVVSRFKIGVIQVVSMLDFIVNGLKNLI